MKKNKQDLCQVHKRKPVGRTGGLVQKKAVGPGWVWGSGKTKEVLPEKGGAYKFMGECEVQRNGRPGKERQEKEGRKVKGRESVVKADQGSWF